MDFTSYIYYTNIVFVLSTIFMFIFQILLLFISNNFFTSHKNSRFFTTDKKRIAHVSIFFSILFIIFVSYYILDILMNI